MTLHLLLRLTVRYSASTVKIDPYCKAKVLNQQEIQLLFIKGLTTVRDRTVCAVMRYTAWHVRE
ncbi:hypothetical protein [Nostoc sp. FACHB-190]|uniref:hypothetical protein n=1 Tax=Nostoc sp. FACHB-190 TaxID=2692838 RepID=UPI001A7EE735|nr:hypothetical protein [Nostoc sp. FACHB-190]